MPAMPLGNVLGSCAWIWAADASRPDVFLQARQLKTGQALQPVP